MVWSILENEIQLQQVIQSSYTKPQAIFKHSTRCAISSIAQNRIERCADDSIEFHHLDLLSQRGLSNIIAEKLSVYHESPQVLLLQNGECIYDESHNAIDFFELKNAIQSVQ